MSTIPQTTRRIAGGVIAAASVVTAGIGVHLASDHQDQSATEATQPSVSDQSGDSNQSRDLSQSSNMDQVPNSNQGAPWNDDAAAPDRGPSASGVGGSGPAGGWDTTGAAGAGTHGS